MSKFLTSMIQIFAVIHQAVSECETFIGEKEAVERMIDFGERTAVKFLFAQPPGGNRADFHVALKNVNRDHILRFLLTQNDLSIFNDYDKSDWNGFLPFLPQKAPVRSLKFSTHRHRYRIDINGKRVFEFADYEMKAENRTMLYGYMHYEHKFSVCVYKELNKKI